MGRRLTRLERAGRRVSIAAEFVRELVGLVDALTDLTKRVRNLVIALAGVAIAIAALVSVLR